MAGTAQGGFPLIPMKRCIIHIGAHKTGSTSIQRSLHGFGDGHFLYAGLDQPNHSLAMQSLFGANPALHHIHLARGRDAAGVAAYTDRARAALEKSIAAAGDRALLISGESISLMAAPSLLRLRDHFLSHCDELSIVGYVRPPGAFMSSSFQQRVKSGSANEVRAGGQYREYRKTFGALDEVFGRENVQLWKFDPQGFPDHCVVRDFCARLGIALPSARIVRVNESMSRQAVSLLYIYRKMSPEYGFRSMRAPEAQKLGRLLAAAGEGKFRFSPDVIRPVLEQHREDIAWMEARLGQSLHEELGEHREGDIREGADLLKPDPSAVSRLLAALGDAAPAGNRGDSPGDVARLVHALREKVSGPTAGAPRGSLARRLLNRVRIAFG